MINSLSSENPIKNSIYSSTEKSFIDKETTGKELKNQLDTTEERILLSQQKIYLNDEFFLSKKPSVVKKTQQFLQSAENSSGQLNNLTQSKPESITSINEIYQLPIRSNKQIQTHKSPVSLNLFKKLPINEIITKGSEYNNKVRVDCKSVSKSTKLGTNIFQEKSSSLAHPFQELFMKHIRNHTIKKRLTNNADSRRNGLTRTRLRTESVLRVRLRRNQSIGIANKNKEHMQDPMSLFESISKSAENTKYGQTKILIKVIDFILALLVICNIILSLLDNEIYYSQTDAYIAEHLKNIDISLSSKEEYIYLVMQERALSTTENTLRLVNMIIVACVLFLIFVHYKLYARLLRIEGLLSEFEGIYGAGFLKRMLIEMCILIWTYPPYFNNLIYGTMLGQPYAYSVNSLICIIVTFKSYILLRIYSYFSNWTSDIAKSICNKLNISANIHFAVKAELKKRPYWTLTFLFGSAVILLSFSLRIFEYYVGGNNISFGSSKSSSNDLKLPENYLRSIATCVWLILVTMTTVGYGDYVPNTHYGRLIGFLSCIIGLLLVSVIIVSLAIITEFSEEEKKAYSLIKKLTACQNVQQKAYEVIVTIFKLRKILMNTSKYKFSEKFILIVQLKKTLSDFKNDCKIASSLSLPPDQTYKIIQEKLNFYFQTLVKEIKKIENIDEIFDKLSSSQLDCSEKMKVIENRTESIANYLLKQNNDNFKKSILNYYKRLGKSNLFKLEEIGQTPPSLYEFKDISPVSNYNLDKRRNLNDTINEAIEEENDLGSL